MKLTPAGKSLYEDTKTLIRLSEDTLNKARLLAESSEYTVRIGTSLLYKFRLISEIWASIGEQIPELKISKLIILKNPENREVEEIWYEN